MECLRLHVLLAAVLLDDIGGKDSFGGLYADMWMRPVGRERGHIPLGSLFRSGGWTASCINWSAGFDSAGGLFIRSRKAPLME